MIAYKLLRVRKDGTLGSLFIGRREHLKVGTWLRSRFIPTRGFAKRRGWHCTESPHAPHLSMEGREWYIVDIPDESQVLVRPKSQGGTWFLARRMKILGPS